jgi:glycosyltransferase involved in cell wall biosynthesis
MWGLLPSLLSTLERSGIPLTYAISSPWVLDYEAVPHRWSAFWEARRSQGIERWVRTRLVRILRQWVDASMPTRLPRPNLQRAFFASRALRKDYVRAGWNCEGSPIIYHGVDIERFKPLEQRQCEKGDKLLFSGRVVREKGLHIAVEALAALVREGRGHELTLDVVGPQPDPEYASSVQDLVQQYELERAVRFHTQASRGSMPEIYRDHDVLVFPSIWEEPFSLTVLESMACGLPVVGSATGGSKEILVDEVTGLVASPGDAASLACQLRRILAEPRLGSVLAQRARQRICQDFTLTGTVDQIEEFLYHNLLK